LVLFVLEANIASHGVLALGGTAAMILGAMILIDTSVPELRIHLRTALTATLPFALITVFLVRLALKARSLKVATGAAGMVDEIGVARTALAPEGSVFVHGEWWSAVSDVPVPEGAKVRVVGLDGLKLRVTPSNNSPGKEEPWKSTSPTSAS
jgi:membrane-bound serine protease (ClpP class)